MRGEHEHNSSLDPATAGALPALDRFEMGTDPVPGPIRLPLDTTSGHHSFAPLRDACAAELDEAMECGDTANIPPLVKAVAEFALIDRGALRPGSRRAQQTLRVGRLCLARRLIARHLSKPSLSPAMVAGLLGVSVRYIHVLFETTGTSFSQTVTALRMARSRRLLRETPPISIAEIADACGFGSLATFYRVFNASEGVTPGEFRAQTGASPFTSAAPSDPEAASHLTGK
jgi:AraC-like DNA-binding protein